jgi:DNA-directed RNA polymerase beta subunit
MINDELVLFSPQIETFTPFAGHIDASRLNMASKQQLQCVVSSKTDTPLIIDKDYKKITTVNSPFAEFAKEDGLVIMSDYETMIVHEKESKRASIKAIPPVKKMINNSLSLRYKAPVGPIKKGELLFDYTNMNTDTFMPRIGYRAKILFSSFFGYTADDAMVISEGFSKRAEIEYSQKIFIPITKEWKYLRNDNDSFFYTPGQVTPEEAYIRYFPIDSSDHFMSEINNMSEQNSMFFTKNIAGIKEGEVVSLKVHRNNDKSFTKLHEEYIYTPGLMHEIETVYNQSQKVRLASEIILNRAGLSPDLSAKDSQEIFDTYYSVPKFTKFFETKLKDEFNLDPTNVDFILEVTIKKVVKTTRGDKFTNIFAGKGTVSMIVPDSIMPVDPETGKPVDIIFNPLGIFGRNNWGVIFELGLSKIAEEIELKSSHILAAEKFDLIAADEILYRIEFLANKFISKYDAEYCGRILKTVNYIRDSMNAGELNEVAALLEDIVRDGFYIFVPNFPGITYTDFYNELIMPYSLKFGTNFKKSKVKLKSELFDWLRDKWHYKNNVISDERIDLDIEAFIGTNYMLKLYHTSYSKFTSVSLANSYSKITGQPVRGRKKTGGQHISWQTLAALLGHKEHSGILKELYTIKSDAPIKEKEKFLMQYITHGKYRLKPKYVSLTKRAVNNSLKILGMQLKE